MYKNLLNVKKKIFFLVKREVMKLNKLQVVVIWISITLLLPFLIWFITVGTTHFKEYKKYYPLYLSAEPLKTMEHPAGYELWILCRDRGSLARKKFKAHTLKGSVIIFVFTSLSVCSLWFFKKERKNS